MIKRGWIPPRSPYSLLQEDLWSGRPESEWLILVSCIMLNCTTRKQVEKVLPEFRRRWPTPQSFMEADFVEVATLIASLGFLRRRTLALKKMTERYLTSPWQHASELPGIGTYGARTWEIFCMDVLGDEPPQDHALVQYWSWRTELSGLDFCPIQQVKDVIVVHEKPNVRH